MTAQKVIVPFHNFGDRCKGSVVHFLFGVYEYVFELDTQPAPRVCTHIHCYVLYGFMNQQMGVAQILHGRVAKFESGRFSTLERANLWGLHRTAGFKRGQKTQAK